nr:PREDICTED: uncharacterized protein LOC102350913 [Latimeria chalumnae]|eukprot:XP_006006797.1 PREDICTED: uncharacterized protein LOC102350913 [Latimeria chalumnae]
MSKFSLLLVSVCHLYFAASGNPNSLSFSYGQSLSLSRRTLQDVQTLLDRYKKEQFPECCGLLRLSSLPLTSMTYRDWLSMKDEERLQINAKDLQVFWIHIDAKRIHDLGEGEQNQLTQSLEAVQVNLRDLIHQIILQLSVLNSTVPSTSELTIPDNLLRTQNDWLSRLQGYIILRDLERYLSKVIHDFTYLYTKHDLEKTE